MISNTVAIEVPPQDWVTNSYLKRVEKTLVPQGSGSIMMVE
jgi:hypothetical protein